MADGRAPLDRAPLDGVALPDGAFPWGDAEWFCDLDRTEDQCRAYLDAALARRRPLPALRLGRHGPARGAQEVLLPVVPLPLQRHVRDAVPQLAPPDLEVVPDHLADDPVGGRTAGEPTRGAPRRDLQDGVVRRAPRASRASGRARRRRRRPGPDDGERRACPCLRAAARRALPAARAEVPARLYGGDRLALREPPEPRRLPRHGAPPARRRSAGVLAARLGPRVSAAARRNCWTTRRGRAPRSFSAARRGRSPCGRCRPRRG